MSYEMIIMLLLVIDTCHGNMNKGNMSKGS